MPARPLTLIDPNPRVPDTSGVKWWTDAPWRQLVIDRPVDAARTAKLAQWEVVRDGKVLPVRLNGNTPLQLAGNVNTRTFEAKRPGTFTDPFPSTVLPLQPKVWISTNNDHTWFAVDIERQRYWEASSFGPMLGGYAWRADTIRSFDLSKPWHTQPGSISASRIPTWALVPTIAQLNAGTILSALPLVCAGYGNGPPIWPSRGTDGYIGNGHPLDNGARLRFTREAYERLSVSPGPQDQALAFAGRYLGFIVVDKTGEFDGHSVRLPKSADLNLNMRFTLTDLEVLI